MLLQLHLTSLSASISPSGLHMPVEKARPSQLAWSLRISLWDGWLLLSTVSGINGADEA